WDLCGLLTLDRQRVAPLLATGDTRWIHRAAYDLLDYQPHAQQSSSPMPRGRSLYGSLPAQLADPAAFASRLAPLPRVRTDYRIDVATQLDVPQVSQRAMLVMVHGLEPDTAGGPRRRQVTVLNFSDEPIAGSVLSDQLPPGGVVIDLVEDKIIGEVDDLHSFPVMLDPFQALSLLVDPVGDEPPDA